MNTSICHQCKTPFRHSRKTARFCSVKCKGEWQKTQKPVDEAWLRQKYLVEHLSTYDIAKLVSRDPKQVHRWLTGYGIPTRPRGENLANSDDCYMRRPGAVSAWLGRTHTEETRKILSKKAKTEKPWLRGEANGMSGKTGEMNPNYIDGSSPERQRLYASGKFKAALRAVYKRDGHCCQRCGSPKIKRKWLHAHHISPWAGNPELRFDPDNLVTLCRICHSWVHSAANATKEYLR